MSAPPLLRRRSLLAAALGACGAGVARAQPAPARVPLADMHSHYGLLQRKLDSSGVAEDLREQGVALMAWKLVADQRWLRAGATGIVQATEPRPDELAAHFEGQLSRMKAYLARHNLRTVLTKADVDAALAGNDPGVVLASEGADFLEGRVDALAGAVAQGLRHLQLVHYIRNPIGDFQTESPVHQGLSEAGRRLVEACNAQGVLVDLAHGTAEVVEQALQVAKAPVVWSHGWVDKSGGHWQDALGYMRRRLSLEHARRIAAAGGVIGLWGLGLAAPAPRVAMGDGGWTVGRGDTRGLAREVAALVQRIGAEHVAIGSDIEGVGTGWALNQYGHVRSVIDRLQDEGLSADAVERVAYRNYARVLKAALKEA